MNKFILLLFLFSLAYSADAQENKESKKMWAKSILNQKAPALDGVEWVTKKPKTKGKFVLVDFWTTGCVPCKKAIPEFNKWSKQFKKDLVVIGVALQKTEQLKAFNQVPIDYYSGADPKKTISKELNVTGVPHVLLIDPDGIVRWEGFPLLAGHELTAEVIEGIIQQYKKDKKKCK